MQINWQTIFENVGVTGVIIAAVSWLAKKLVSEAMARDTEKFRIELKAAADSQIERQKNELRMLALEHQVRFSKLHEKRAEVIAQIYKLMNQTTWAAQGFVYGDASDRKKAEFARSTAIELREFFELHKLYLPNSVCIVLDQFIKKLSFLISLIKAFWIDVEFPNERMMLERNEKMLEAVKALETDLPRMQDLLEAKFRQLLGAVEEEWLIPAQG